MDLVRLIDGTTPAPPALSGGLAEPGLPTTDPGTSPLLVGALLLLAGLVVGTVLGLLLGRSRTAGRGDDRPDPVTQVAAVLAPAGQALARVEERLREVERDRAGAYAGLREQVAALLRTSTELGQQTRSLAGALRAPAVRGRWGEVQLQRIVELAGMVEHCDFDTQVHRPGGGRSADERRGVRPDMVIRLSGGRCIPVDAKVPFAAWLEALDTDDPPRQAALLTAHARAMRAHVDALAGKAYWERFEAAPEFVVMFVPGEPLLDAAMTRDPGLAEYAFERSVVIATPTSLMALLRTVAFTWRQERLSASAAQIHELGRDLHRRLSTLTGHLTRMGTGLHRAVESYNDLVGSTESRVLVTARRFTDLGVAGPPLPEVVPLTVVPRRPRPPHDRAGRDAGLGDPWPDPAPPDTAVGDTAPSRGPGITVEG
ncbi:DNA recombination protein RmuC [Nakamurella leprariae]|uniref:DNA recombination protein RmuC n=1 Tax=Nakamurella leprariae TaxID=2803911 RepID=UPI002E2AE0D6|nr:DNA recombination protein RmuC [Nakamurella leprariae]